MPDTSNDYPIICFGEALIDFLANPSAPGETRTFRQFAGGAPANAAVAIAKLGGRCEFVGMLGQDMFGDFLLESLSEAGVGTQHIHRTAQANTALAFVSLDEHGERSFSFYRPPAADLLFRDEDFDATCFTDAGIFHCCSNSLTEPNITTATLSGMNRARAAGALVSMDLNLRPALWPGATPKMDVLWQALQAADLVKLAREELDFLKGNQYSDETIVTRLLNNARLILLTDGAAPIRWFSRSDHGQLPTFAVRAVDTTAAGDAFIGGLLSQLQRRDVVAHNFGSLLAQRYELETCLRYAAACGALAVTRYGAFAALPKHDEAMALMSVAE